MKFISHLVAITFGAQSLLPGDLYVATGFIWKLVGGEPHLRYGFSLLEICKSQSSTSQNHVLILQMHIVLAPYTISLLSFSRLAE